MNNKLFIFLIPFICMSVSSFDIDVFNLSMSSIKSLNICTTDISYSFEDNKPGNCTTPTEVDAEGAYNFIISKNPIVIDIRTPEEYAQGHIEYAKLNIDFYNPNFKDEISKLDKGGKYLIYCRTGGRSAKALDIMKEMGFTDVHHIKGGITAWQQAGYPVVK